jgi:hypothetical protein
MTEVLTALICGGLGFGLGYYVCHRGLSKALADAEQAVLDAKTAAAAAEQRAATAVGKVAGNIAGKL